MSGIETTYFRPLSEAGLFKKILKKRPPRNEMVLTQPEIAVKLFLYRNI